MSEKTNFGCYLQQTLVIRNGLRRMFVDQFAAGGAKVGLERVWSEEWTRYLPRQVDLGKQVRIRQRHGGRLE